MYAIRSYYDITTFVGEYGLSDSNELQLHGSNGFKFTTGNYFNGEEIAMDVITSYSIHYTKLYELEIIAWY